MPVPRFVTLAFSLAVLASPSTPARATDINFASLPGAKTATLPGTPFKTPYTQNGFTVTPTVGQFMEILAAVSYVGIQPLPPDSNGNVPVLREAKVPVAITVRASGGKLFLFSFASLAHDNELTGPSTTYRFVGSRQGKQVFTQTGSLGEHGAFEVYRNTHSVAVIDSLSIALFQGPAILSDINVTLANPRFHSR